MSGLHVGVFRVGWPVATMLITVDTDVQVIAAVIAGAEDLPCLTMLRQPFYMRALRCVRPRRGAEGCGVGVSEPQQRGWIPAQRQQPRPWGQKRLWPLAAGPAPSQGHNLLCARLPQAVLQMEQRKQQQQEQSAPPSRPDGQLRFRPDTGMALYPRTLGPKEADQGPGPYVRSRGIHG